MPCMVTGDVLLKIEQPALWGKKFAYMSLFIINFMDIKVIAHKLQIIIKYTIRLKIFKLAKKKKKD